MKTVRVGSTNVSSRHATAPSLLYFGTRRWKAPLLHAAKDTKTSDAVDTEAEPSTSSDGDVDLSKQISKQITKASTTFAPRASGKVKNPAVKGSTLYYVFEYQAWLALVVGGLLSFNLIFPSDKPDIPRLLGMWSVWMFTIPSLRAKETMPKEKDALNLLFLLVPLINVTLPLIWKSFPFIFMADVVAIVSVYYWKGVWAEVYGLPLGPGDSKNETKSD